MNKVLFSSAKEDWETPIDLYNKLNEEFHFDLDPCADNTNHKCDKYYTKDDNGLIQDWGGGTRYFVIHLMGECLQANGSKNVQKKRKNQTPRWLCSFQQEQTLNLFTNTYMEKQRSDLSRGD